MAFSYNKRYKSVCFLSFSVRTNLKKTNENRVRKVSTVPAFAHKTVSDFQFPVDKNGSHPKPHKKTEHRDLSTKKKGRKKSEHKKTEHKKNRHKKKEHKENCAQNLNRCCA